jgi:hypothetical protein
MKRRTKVVLLVAGLAVATVVVLSAAPAVVLSVALTWGLDARNLCETGFSSLVNCTLRLSTTTTSRRGSRQPDSVDATAWAVVQCPENYIAKRLLCAAPSGAAPAQAASDDTVTGLPLPKPWFVRTAKDSPFIKSLHLETPLDLSAALGFYRAELSKRGWTENDGAVVAPDRAVIAFTTTDGPALLRLIRQDDRTIADLSLRKSAAAKSASAKSAAAANDVIQPRPGQAKLMLGNARDEEAVITINAQTITLAARAGDKLAVSAGDAGKLPDSQKIDLPPGRYKVTLNVASGAAQNREFEVAADETWALLVGPDGVPLPVHLY